MSADTGSGRESRRSRPACGRRAAWCHSPGRTSSIWRPRPARRPDCRSRMAASCTTSTQVDSPHPVGVRDWTGTRLPMHAVSAGLVVLAHASLQDVDRYLARPLERFTPATVVDPTLIRERLRLAQRDGYAWTRDELAEGGTSVLGRDRRRARGRRRGGPRARSLISIPVVGRRSDGRRTGGGKRGPHLGRHPAERRRAARAAWRLRGASRASRQLRRGSSANAEAPKPQLWLTIRPGRRFRCREAADANGLRRVRGTCIGTGAFGPATAPHPGPRLRAFGPRLRRMCAAWAPTEPGPVRVRRAVRSTARTAGFRWPFPRSVRSGIVHGNDALHASLRRRDLYMSSASAGDVGLPADVARRLTAPGLATPDSPPATSPVARPFDVQPARSVQCPFSLHQPVSSTRAVNDSVPGSLPSSSSPRSSPAPSGSSRLVGLALFASSAFGTRFWILGKPWPAIRSALKLGPTTPEHEYPPRFAQAMGATFLGLALILFVLGLTPLALAAGRGRRRRLQTLARDDGLLRLGCRLYFLRWWVPSQFARLIGAPRTPSVHLSKAPRG